MVTISVTVSTYVMHFFQILPLVLATSNFEVFVADSFLPFEIGANFEVSYFIRGMDSCSNFSQR
jgi:hypothetical protein